MNFRNALFTLYLFLNSMLLFSQSSDSVWLFTGVVYDNNFTPLPFTHVLAHGTSQGDVTDSLGIFSIYIRKQDKLSFSNIACRDTSVYVRAESPVFSIRLRRKYYVIREARVFSWGSSYNDFLDEVERLGKPSKMGEELNLPTQTPGVIPFNFNEKLLSSPRFLLTSPISFFYYNLSKQEKAARKAFELEQDRELIDAFEALVGVDNISEITGLEGKALEDFLLYYNERMHCTIHSSELDIIQEIFAIWERYKAINSN